MKTLLAVDLSNQLYRACHSYSELQHEGEFTGGLYGVLTLVAQALRWSGASRLIFCADSRPYVRSTTYPAYKALRKTTSDPELRELVAVARQQVLQVCGDIGVGVWSVPGFEADDLAALLVRQHRNRFHEIWSMSNDSDLAQLLDCPNFVLLKGAVKQKGYREVLPKLLRGSDFAAEFPGFSAEDYVLWLALQGTHNEVEGIPGVGPVKAMNAVKTPSVLAKLMEQHGELVERNRALIRLPHAQLPRDTPLPELRPLDSRALYRSCARYGIKITPGMSAAFDQLT